MSGALLASRGCVYVVQAAGQSGAGLYAIAGFPQASPSAPILLQGVQLSDNDIVLPVATLDNFQVLYTFGQDFGNIIVMGEILLGPAGSSAAGLTNLLDWFTQTRVSASPTPQSLSMPGGTSKKFYVVGLSLGHPDPELNIQPFAISGIVAAPPN